jgi:hypothetical protein
MRWFEYEPDKKFPWVPLERDRSGDWRVELSLASLILGVAAMAASIITALFGAATLSTWALVISLVSIFVCWLSAPSGDPKG